LQIERRGEIGPPDRPSGPLITKSNNSVTKMFSTDDAIRQNNLAMKMSPALLCLFSLGILTIIPVRTGESKGAVGPGSVIVQSKFGGQIFGFDIDLNGNEGILRGALSLACGKYLAAVETNLHAREGTLCMNTKSRVSFLTNTAEVKTIAATSAPHLILPDRMTG
jgi:hypothetical protein